MPCQDGVDEVLECGRFSLLVRTGERLLTPPAETAHTLHLVGAVMPITVAVMSNTNAAHVLWLDEYLPELREFDLVMMSNEVGLIKPDPAIFETALELLNVAPQQAIFIDDIAENVEAARTLGLAGIVHARGIREGDRRAGGGRSHSVLARDAGEVAAAVRVQ